MKTIEAVIFDCDGIVVDSDQLQRDAEQQTAPVFAEENGLIYDPDKIEWSSMQGWARRNIAASIYSISADSEIADKFRLAVVDKTVELACAENVPLIPGIVSFYNYLVMRGLRMGLATASNRKIYERYCALNEMDLFHHDYIVAHGECKDDKPKPGPFLELMARMHAEPDKTLVIEDSSSGITAGRYAGAIVLGVATTKSSEYLRTGTGAHLVAEDFKDAAKILQPYLPR